MSLSNLIRGKKPAEFATAILAIPAIKPREESTTVAKIATIAIANPPELKTTPGKEAETVAGIATIAVANPKEWQTVSPEKISANDSPSIFRCWRIRYPDRDPVEVTCCPPATHTEILAHHPGAVAAEPFAPTIQKPSALMTVNQAAVIRAWLDSIGENNPAIIAEVMTKCQRDMVARFRFLNMAGEIA